MQCISKGKAHKRYEFGQKVAVATTNRSNWFVAARLLEDNPYDGHTLSETLATVENVTGVAVTDTYVDKGYRGHGYTGGADVHIAGQRGKNTTRAERKRRRRRSAIEPKISHLKSNHRMGRCFLARLCGDAINAVLAAAGANLRKLLGLLRRAGGRFLFALCDSLARPIPPLIRRIMSLPEPRGGYVAPAYWEVISCQSSAFSYQSSATSKHLSANAEICKRRTSTPHG